MGNGKGRKNNKNILFQKKTYPKENIKTKYKIFKTTADFAAIPTIFSYRHFFFYKFYMYFNIRDVSGVLKFKIIFF